MNYEYILENHQELILYEYFNDFKYDIINEYFNTNIISDNNLIGDALGLGDILFIILLNKYKLHNNPYYININHFDNKDVNDSKFLFIIKLLHYLLKYNEINMKIIFIKSTNLEFNDTSYLNCPNNNKIKDIPYTHLDIVNIHFNEVSYIIFHTKYRTNLIDERLFDENKKKIKHFCDNYKSNYTIYI